MSSEYTYPGDELDLFGRAANWKRYFSGLLNPYLKGNILEAGAGTGNTTPYLNRNPDISSWLLLEPDGKFCRILHTAISNSKLPSNCNILHGDIHSLSEDSFFDAIVYVDVLEHIENDHEEIDAAIKHLKKDGHLIILSPAHQKLYSPFDKAIGHYRRYDKRSIKKLVDNKRMSIVRLIYLDSLGSMLSWGNKRLAKQSSPTEKQIIFWDKLLVPLSKIIDRMVLYNFGRSILGVWKKNESIS